MNPLGTDGRRYNVTLARLIKTIVSMSEKQQLIMLRLAEELLYRQKKPVRLTADSGTMVRNRPSHPRKPSSIIVNFSVGNRFYTDYIEDIHPEGVLIGTREDFAIGEEVALAFSHPKFPDIFRVYGDITYVSDEGIGVQFKNLSKPQKDRIKALVNWIKGLQT